MPKPYKSELTLFLEELKAKDPTLEDRQRQGRSLLWDKAVDRQQLRAAAESNVPQRPYVYQPELPLPPAKR